MSTSSHSNPATTRLNKFLAEKPILALALIDSNGLDQVAPFSSQRYEFLLLRQRFNSHRDPKIYILSAPESTFTDVDDFISQIYTKKINYKDYFCPLGPPSPDQDVKPSAIKHLEETAPNRFSIDL